MTQISLTTSVALVLAMLSVASAPGALAAPAAPVARRAAPDVAPARKIDTTFSSSLSVNTGPAAAGGRKAAAPISPFAATGTILFQNAFNNRTVDGTGTVTLPTPTSGSNVVCLTATGNTTVPPLLSCTSIADAQGAGTLRFTSAAAGQVGGVFGSTSFPSSNGLDVTFSTYQYGGGGADGLGFVLAAVDPANPVPPAGIGPSGGSLGYTPAGSLNGLPNAYLGVGLDVFGNFSNSSGGFTGTGCGTVTNITSPVPGAAVVRGPGNLKAGYCALTTTYDGTTNSKATLKAATRAASVVPVEVLINPTASAFTSASSITVAAGTYKVVVTPVSQSTKTLTGPLPTAPAALYPSTTWLSANGIPKQLAFGFVGSTGGTTDVHEVSDVKVLTFNPVPQLAVATTSYSAATTAAGGPVNYSAVASVSAGADENSAISVTQTLPTGSVPVGAYGLGWNCGGAVGRTISCTTTATSFTNGTALPAITIIGIVTAASMTASVVQNGSSTAAGSADANPGTDTVMAAGAVPTAPSGVSETPAIGPIAGGSTVTVSFTSTAVPTAIEIGTSAEQAAGTPVVLLPCVGAATVSCFNISGSTAVIPAIPARASAAAVSITLVTLGVATAVGYVYADKPATPAAPTATAGITSATVSWVAPAINGSAITGYILTPYLNNAAQTALNYDASATTKTLTGLTAGGSYTYTVAAINAYGTSSTSPKSVAVVPYALPGAPTITAVSAGNSAATVTWTAPSSNGSSITSYVLTPYIGTVAQTAQTFNSTALTQIATGLTVGTAYTFTVAAINAAGTGPASAKSSAVTPNPGPALTFAAPPAGEIAVVYPSTTLTVTGGTTPFTWSLSTGVLPAGLTLNATTGQLSGTPTASGSFPFTVQVTDASTGVATQAVTLVIAAAPVVSFTPPAGDVTVAYSAQATVAGGTGPFAWSIIAGSLPAGITLNASTGQLSGTPTAAGSFTVALQVKDAFNQLGNKTASIVIGAVPTLTSTPPAGQSGVFYNFSFAANGGSAPFTYSVTSGTLPSGLTLTTAGVLSGASSKVANTPITVTVVDNLGLSATDSFTLVIAAAPVAIVKTASVTSVGPGGVVRYTITAINSSSTLTYNGARIFDPLTDVLDDAVYNNDAAATSGTVSANSSGVTWDVNMGPGTSWSMTYSVTVSNPDAGNKVLGGTVSTSFLSTNCNPGEQDSRCSAPVTVGGMSILQTTDVASTTPASVVRFTVLVTNTGQTPFAAATLNDNATGVIDDATYNSDATATAGSVSVTAGTVTWTGPLAVGASVTITFSMTVKNPDTGDKSMIAIVSSTTPGNVCPSGAPTAGCTATVGVLVPALTITNTSSVVNITPGGAVPYTATIKNTGQTTYTSTSVTIALAAALDDATYNTDASVAGGGTVVYNPGPGTLVWTGNLAIGATVTVTASVTVRNPDPGDKTLTAVASSPAAGSTCPSGNTLAACTATTLVLVPGLTISKSANVTSTTPGSVVTYTVVVTNSGQTDYTGATFADPLTGVLDDAAYNNNVAATVGAVSFAGSTVTWTGNLAIAATATITYTVTVKNPDPGDKTMAATVTSTTAGNNCLSGSGDARCTSSIALLIPALTLTSATDAGATTTPGAVVHYTFTVANSGPTTYTGLVVNLVISGLTDDATYDNDVVASTGSLTGGTLWTLSLAPGGSATITESYTVKNPDSGDKILKTIVSSDAAGSTCPSGSANTACQTSVTVLIPGLTITKTANNASVTPGDTVVYTVTVLDSGQTPYAAATFTDSLASVLSDATYAGGATASAGTVSYASPTLTWTGALAVGATATISYSVTVRNPDPGDKLMTNTIVSTSAGSNCAAGSVDAKCTAAVTVLVPGLTIAKSANTATTIPGAVVVYTVTVTNSGATAYTGATFTDSLNAVLDDATYNANAAATSGAVSYAAPNLTWTGDLAVGAIATITYSVNVNTAPGGNNLLTDNAVSTTRNSNCPSGSTDTRCTVTVPVARLLLVQGSLSGTTTPGSVLDLSATYTNIGQVPYTGITVNTLGADGLDDVIGNGDQTASSGSLAISGTGAVWTGSIAIGGVVTVTGSVTVLNPDTGNKTFSATLTSTAPGNNCPSGGTDPRCTETTTVLVPSLTITNTAGTTTAVPGQTVGYTVTIVNSGQTAYTNATVTDALTGIIDDATYGNNAATTAGAVSFASPTLTWTGNLLPGATATLTFTATVQNPDTGDKGLSSLVTSTVVGSTCPVGTGNAACSNNVSVLVPGLTMIKTANTTTTTLGATVTYTVTVTDSGQTSYAPASFTDSLATVTDDAVYDAGATTASIGTATFSAGTLGWSGALNPGDVATIVYTVTVNNPDIGDRSMVNTLVSTSAGGNCANGSSDTRCTATVTVTNQVTLRFTKTADVTSTVAGAVVHYTVRALNSSSTALNGVNFTDPLVGVLDDVAYNADVAASGGVATFTSPNLTWAGSIAAGATVTVTYSVTVHATIAGDENLVAAVFSTSIPASDNCLVGSVNPLCGTAIPVAALVIVQTAPASTTPGSVVRLTTTFTNTGQVPYTGITITSPAADVSDDSITNGDQTATSGTFTIGPTQVTWSGNIPIGGSVTITGTITVLDPDPGNKIIAATWVSTAPGSNCQSGSPDARCTSVTNVLTPGLTISQTANTTTVVTGGTVGYTVSIRNTGQTAYASATVTDSLLGLLDDSVYNNNAATTAGGLSYAAPTLTWTGSLAVGAIVTITYTATVNNPDPGDKSMYSFLTSTAIGSTCPVGTSKTACSTIVVVLTPGLTMVKTANVATAPLGSTVTYTVTVTDSGQTAYPSASFADSLAAVVDDATYNAGATTASIGTAIFNPGVLSWSGALSPGDVATIVYTVTVGNPDSGNQILSNTLVSASAGSNCATGSNDTRCTATVAVTNAATLTFTQTADVATTVAGAVVHYTVQVLNSSAAAVAANFSDPLAGVLDDASYNNNAVASLGTPTFTSLNLTWTGTIPAGVTATVTYSVTVNATITGNELLTGTLSSTSAPGSNNCASGSTDSRCRVTVPVAALLVQVGALPSTTTPGAVLPTSSTFTNTGQVPYTGITLSALGADLLDDTVANGDEHASSGTLAVTPTALTWTGDIPVGGVITITSTVTVSNPDLGNKLIVSPWVSTALGNNCPSGSTDPRCTITISVLLPGLTVSTTAGTPRAVSGDSVGYTVTIRNAGQTPYTAATSTAVTVTDSLAGMLDDATYNGDATAAAGGLSYSSPTLTWTGDLAVGAVVTISFSMTVLAPDPGDKTMINAVTSTAIGSSCPPASGNPACRVTVAVLTSGLTIVKTASLTAATLGAAVTYTVTVTNTGQTAYASANFTDPLTGVVDDANFNGTASATTGTTSYVGGVLSWAGSLGLGASATITYTVTVGNPDNGDRSLTNTIASISPGSNCGSSSIDTRCTVTIPVVNSVTLTFFLSSDVLTTASGGTVNYTVTMTNSSAATVTGANFTDPLGDVIDDATYNNDASVTGGGTATYTSPNLTWTGDIAPAATVTVRYSVTVKPGITGNQILAGTLSSTSVPDSDNCISGSQGPRCTSTVPVARLQISQGYTETSTTPGSLVHLSATFHNTGQAQYNGITIASPSAGTVDDANPLEQTASSGALVLTASAIIWTGDIPIGATITVSGTLTVKNPDPGDKLLTGKLVSAASGNNCPSGGSDPLCTASLPVQLPGLTITKTANTGAAAPGGPVGYTVVVTNSGQTPYTAATSTAATITDSLLGLLDDATYNGVVTASTGTATFTSPNVTWTGDLPVNASVTITYSVNVRNPDPGDKIMAGSVISANVGSTCPAASSNPTCSTTVVVLAQSLTIVKTASVTAAPLGSTVTYTVTVIDTGATSYSPATFTDSLAGVTDDATYNADVAGPGTATFSGGVLSWSGALNPGDVAVITYSVTVLNPDTGNGSLTDTVVSTTPNSNCAAASPDPRCATTVVVTNAASLTFSQTADASTTFGGGVVRYTVSVLNSSTVAIAGVNFTDGLAGVLDDATYNADVLAGLGTATFTSPNLTWTGTLPAGGTAIVTFSVTVDAARTGDAVLAGPLTSTSAPNSDNCLSGSADPSCSRSIPVAYLVLQQVHPNSSTTPGSVVPFASTYTNTGQVPYVNIGITSNRSTAADDVSSNGDQTVSSGALSFVGGNVTWTGDIPIGGTVSVGGSVTVDNPDLGDKSFAAVLQSAAPGNNCPIAGTDPRCTDAVTVLIPGLTIVKSANTTSVAPGGVVTYTITIKDTGQTPYTGAVVTDTVAGVPSNGTYQTASTDSGVLSYTAPTLTWTGNLAVGATATITYSVTVLDPDTGSGVLAGPVSSTTVGSTCLPAAAGAACNSIVVVLVQALTIVKTANLTTATLGATVTYTVSITDSGQTSYPSAAFSADLTRLIDDATFDVANTTVGAVAFTSPVLSWSGALNPGQTAVISYSVTVNNPSSGNRIMADTLVSTASGSNCASGSTDTRCTTTVTVVNTSTLRFTKTADVATTVAGGVVRYTVLVLNSSAATLTGVGFTDPLAGVLDDASYDTDVVASGGAAAFDGSNLTWTGSVPAGGTVTVTYSVTVHATITGDQNLTSTLSSTSVPTSDNCLAGSVDTRCATAVPVAALLIVEHSGLATTTPGSLLELTTTFTNIGRVPYVGISVTGDGANLLDDLSPGGSQGVNSGSLTFGATGVTWTGDIPVGGVITIATSAIVLDPDTGNHLIKSTWTSAAVGNNCPVGGTDPACTLSIAVLTPGLAITKTASTPSAVPGGTVNYTIIVTNTGQTAYTAATSTRAVVADDMEGVLDDATLVGTPVASGGGLLFTSPVLTWTGDLAVGASVTIGYSVAVNSPDLGDKTMINPVVSTNVGSSCPPASGNAGCSAVVAVLTPALTITSSGSTPTTVPGATVTYTVTATNTGQTAYPAAVFTVSLAGVLDDAGYNSDVQATLGTASVTDALLSWVGPLNPGDAATVTYSVTVNNPDLGNFLLAQTVVSTTAGNNCPALGTAPRCATSVPVGALHLVLTSDVSVTKPTGVVHYTDTFTNTGQVPFTGTVVGINIAGAADDAAYNGDATATSGSVVQGYPSITWTGDLPVGGTVVVTASVTVNNPDQGNRFVTSILSTAVAGSNCPVGSLDPLCTSNVSVLIPGLAISKVANVTTTTPGSTVGYTITVTNTGATAYTAATVSDPLVGVLNDAAFTGGAVATGGALTYQAGVLTWTGDLAVAAVVIITFSVTVNSPDLGDKTLSNTVISNELGSSCPTGGVDPACTSVVTALIPALAVTVVANTSTTTPGSIVGYTVTVTNPGQTPYSGASVTSALVGAVDDAAYQGDGAATVGSVTFTSPNLTWTGDLAIGASAIISYSMKVAQSDGGDHVLTTAVSSPAPGSTCTTLLPCVNTVTVLTPGLSVSTTSNVTTATPGDPVVFTISLTNTGQTIYTNTTLSADLTNVVDDATFGGTVTASIGVATYTAPNLTWTGSLPLGAVATIVYAVTVNNPDQAGNKTLSSAVIASAPGSTCRAGSGNPACSATVAVLVPGLTITTLPGSPTTTPGSVVVFTVVLGNTGQTAYSGISVADSISGVFPDSVYNNDARVVGGGAVVYAAQILTWTGDLAVGAGATITFSVTVLDPDPGDKRLAAKVVSGAPGTSCPVGNGLAACTAAVHVLVPALVIVQTANIATVVAGSAVQYTVLLTNTGETAYAPATFTDHLSGILDDAAYDGNAAASSGTVSYANGVLSWSGALALAGTATITFSVTTVFPAVGDHHLDNSVLSTVPGNNCVTSVDPRCGAAVTVLVPGLAVVKTVNTSQAVAGGTLTYTISATNTGQADYPAAAITDSLASMLSSSHVTYSNDATATTGVVSFAGNTLSWNGSLPVGFSVLITYSIAVDVTIPDTTVLTNTVVSTAVGSNCGTGSTDPLCTATDTVAARTISLSGITPSFTLTGPPGVTVTADGAMTMTLITNSLGGYSISLQASTDSMAPSTSGNTDRIPIGDLLVRKSGTTAFTDVPGISGSPLHVFTQGTPSATGGDAISNDFQMTIPFVAPDTYTTTLDYIASAQ